MRILLFQEMLKDINYDDMNVVQELIDGATLTGEIPVTGVLDTKLKPARIDIDELMSISDQVKQQIRSRTVSSGDHDMDKLLWEKTVEEAGKGHLSGPYSFDSLPQDCLVSSRFPLLQGGKLRPIDNYSSSLINEASRLNPVSAASGGWGGVVVDSHGFQLPSVPLFTALGATFHSFPFHALHDFFIWHAS